jgi:hypothetical protein
MLFFPVKRKKRFSVCTFIITKYWKKSKLVEVAMKKLIMFIGFLLTFPATVTPDNNGGQPGHLPFAHSHSGPGCGTGGVCYGYAMGRSAGAGSRIYYACSPATMIPPDECSAGSWQSWSVNTALWQDTTDQYLNVTGAIIVKFSNHVSYASMNAGATSVTLYHIRSAGGTPTTDLMYKQSNGTWKLEMSGYGTYWAQGYYRLKTFDVKAQNHFYNGSSHVYNVGNITIAGATGTSPVTANVLWNANYTATALSKHDYPSGYKQMFENLWRKNNNEDAGTTLQISVQGSPLA